MRAEHDAAGRPRRASVQDREAALEERLRALATDLDDEPSPGFRAATRARLVAMAAVRTPGPAPARPAPARRRTRWRARLTAAVAGVAMAVTALGALVALSDDAQPGDVLYGVKRGTEQTQLALAGDDRGLTLLEFAATRLRELDALVEATGGAPSTDLVRDTLATMDAQTTEGAALVLTRAADARDATPLTALGDWAQQQGTGLTDLQPALPADAGADGSLGLVTRVGTRAAELRTALACPTGPATSGADDLGPLPAPCDGAEAPAPSAPATPGAPVPGPDAPAGDQPDPAVPSAVPAPPAPSSAPGGTGAGGAPAAPTGGGTSGDTGTAPSTGGSAPTTAVPTPGLPVPPLPVPGGVLPPAPTDPLRPTGPLLDTPLPICVWPLVC